jgi:hypothetical protein
LPIVSPHVSARIGAGHPHGHPRGLSQGDDLGIGNNDRGKARETNLLFDSRFAALVDKLGEPRRSNHRPAALDGREWDAREDLRGEIPRRAENGAVGGVRRKGRAVRGSASPATRYSAAAANTTMRVPKVIASRVARIAASTEARPLIAQAQGTRSGALARRRASARGKGMPMKKASGAIRGERSAILASRQRGAERDRSRRLSGARWRVRAGSES